MKMVGMAEPEKIAAQAGWGRSNQTCPFLVGLGEVFLPSRGVPCEQMTDIKGMINTPNMSQLQIYNHYKRPSSDPKLWYYTINCHSPLKQSNRSGFFNINSSLKKIF